MSVLFSSLKQFSYFKSSWSYGAIMRPWVLEASIENVRYSLELSTRHTLLCSWAIDISVLVFTKKRKIGHFCQYLTYLPHSATNFLKSVFLILFDAHNNKKIDFFDIYTLKLVSIFCVSSYCHFRGLRKKKTK